MDLYVNENSLHIYFHQVHRIYNFILCFIIKLHKSALALVPSDVMLHLGSSIESRGSDLAILSPVGDDSLHITQSFASSSKRACLDAH